MEAASTLATIVTGEMMQGVLSEVLGMIPIAMPVMCTFIGLRKGISFIRGILVSA